MRALAYPPRDSCYIAANLTEYLQQAGHEVLQWSPDIGDASEAAVPREPEQEGAAASSWAEALASATAVFHVLHGHEQHARTTLLELARTASPHSPVVFVGISTPLTWAATPAPPPAAESAAAAGAGAPTDPAADTASADGRLSDKDAANRRPAAAALPTYHCEQLVLRCQRPGRLATFVVVPGLLYGAGEGDDQLHGLWQAAWEGTAPLRVIGPGHNRLPTLHVCDLAAFCEAVVLSQSQQQQQQPSRASSNGSCWRGGGQQQQQYLLAVDEAHVTQAELVAAVGSLLAHTNTESCACSLTCPPPAASPLLLLDLPLAPSRLPQCHRQQSHAQEGSSLSSSVSSWRRCCPGGLLTHLPDVCQELVAARGITPLRLLLRGPPASGKTHLAQRLAAAYGLLHVNTATILGELQHMDADTQRAAAQQLSGREGRLSPALMASLAQHLLGRHAIAKKQGWVLDGWPRSLQAAAALFSAAQGSGLGGISGSSGSGSEAPGARAGRRESVANLAMPGKEKRRASMVSGGGVAAAGCPAPAPGAALGATAGSPPESGLQCPELLPHFLIELAAPEEELLRRVKVLAAAEAAVTAANASGAKGPATGGSPAGGVTGSSSAGSTAAAAAGRKLASAACSSSSSSSSSAAAATMATSGANGALGWPLAHAGNTDAPPPRPHNTAKDFARRMEAFKALLQEDAADLSAKCAAVVAACTAAQQQVAADSSSKAAGGNAPAGSLQQPPAPRGGGRSSRLATPRHGGAAAATANQLPPGCKLPEHGGFVAFLVEAGTKHLRVTNALDEAAAAGVAALLAASTTPTAALPALRAAEQAVVSATGPPTNYRGFPREFQSSLVAAADDSATPAAAGAADAQHDAAALRLSGLSPRMQRAGTISNRQASLRVLPAASVVSAPPPKPSAMDMLLPDMAQLQAAAEALASEQAAAAAARLSAASGPLVHALMGSLLPDLIIALDQVAVDRPAEPCKVIAQELLAAAQQMQAGHSDPYNAPVYDIQLAKVQAKAEREAARAAAAAAKAAREHTIKEAQAAAAAAEAASADQASTLCTAEPGLYAAEPCGGASAAAPAVPAKAAAAKAGRAAGTRASVLHASKLW